MITQTQTQTQKPKIISNEEYELWGHKVKRIFRIDGRTVPIIPSPAIPHTVRIIYGVSYFEDSKCLECDVDYHYQLDNYVLVPEGSIVLIDMYHEWKCGVVKEGARMKLAEYTPTLLNVEEIECPTKEEIANEHARLLNSGFCIDGLHAYWRVMAILIAKKLYGIEI